MSTLQPPTLGLIRRLAALVAVSVLAGVVAATAVPTLVSADEPLTYRISVSPAGPYTDGQAVTIRVEGPPGLRVTNSGFCHPDMPAATGQDHLTEWCTATVGNGVTGGNEPADPDGVVTMTVRAGVGAAEKTSPALGTSHRWRCDSDSTCRLPLEITPATGRAVFDTSVVLTYRDDDPTAGCGGAADDQISTAAPDRLTEAWAAWTVGRCDGQGIPTSSSFTNDGGSLAQLEGASVDLAYSGVAAGTEGFGAAERPTVHVPLAVNATVLAVAGFHPTTSSVPGVPLWRPIDDVRMSTAEMNALLSGHLTLDEGLQDSLKARNPQLASQGTRLGFALPNALAGPQATTHQMSSLLTARMGSGWAYPNLPSKYDDSSGQPLGGFADYNAVHNSLSMINLSTGKPQLVGDIYKKLAEKPQGVSLVHFYLTDLATARQLGITPVALEDASGAYVMPSSESLTAAASAMTTAENGTLSLDPAQARGGAYPLTFVEYAVAPAEKLVDEDCAPREGEVTAIRDWVGYLVGEGQSVLDPTGLVPLPEAVRAAGAAVVDTIAAAPTTAGPCAEEPTPEAPPTTPETPGEIPGEIPSAGSLPSGSVTPPGSVPVPGVVPAGGPSTPGVGDVPPSDVGADDPTDGRADAADEESIEGAQAVVAETSIPPLRGPLGTGALVATLTLAGLVAATSATGWLSGGRSRGRVAP